MAGATATIVWEQMSNEVLKATISWLSDDATGAVTYTFTHAELQELRGMYLFLMVTDPGASAPTADYDIALTDQHGVDIAGGALGDRHTSTSEQTLPLLAGSVYGDRFIDVTSLAAAITNAGNAKNGDLILYFRHFPGGHLA